MYTNANKNPNLNLLNTPGETHVSDMVVINI